MLREPQKAKILVVDDVPQNVRVLEMNLKSEGYRIVSAYNGREALEKVEMERPDLILLDIMMPGMSGHEVCRQLRRNKSTRAIPVVMITAYGGGVEKKIEALDDGADDFIAKPFDRYELLARVRSLLRVKFLHDELVNANQRLEEELILAKEVQQALLPQAYPDTPNLKFSHKYIPTLAVGGDFFDIQKLSPTSVGIFVCDVMGHGPQAAMITGIVKALLNQFGPNSPGPGDLLFHMNERFLEMMSSGGLPVFITAFCTVIDVANGICFYANAGHPAPFLIQTSHSSIDELKIRPGPALGMIKDVSYQVSERVLEDKDMIFFFTDGLSELTNSGKKQFGSTELRRAILNNIDLPPHSFIEAIISAADAFADGLSSEDDITLLAASYHETGVSG